MIYVIDNKHQWREEEDRIGGEGERGSVRGEGRKWEEMQKDFSFTLPFTSSVSLSLFLFLVSFSF